MGAHGGHGHGHGHGHKGYDDDNGEWMQLLRPSELREVLEFDRARKEVERQIIQQNQAKLAGRSEAERRGRTPSAAGVGGASGRDDVMSALYSKHVEADHLVKLLPRPGDGEKQKQLMWQKIVDFLMAMLSGPWFGTVTIMMTIGAVGVYLYETTLDDEDDHNGGGGWFESGHDYPSWFVFVEYVLLAFFALELGLRAILADHERSFWLSTETTVDVLSVVPSVLFIAFGLRLWGFLRFLRLLRWADIATFVDSRRKKVTNARGDEDAWSSDDKVSGAFARKRESIMAGLKLLAFVARYVLVYAGVIVLFDRAEGGITEIAETGPGEPIEFTSALYMAAMTLSTVGGAVSMSPGARVAAAVAVLVFLPLAAIRVADVIKHSSTTHSAVRAISLTPSVRERHVVMCGSVNATNLQARLQEIFHADHGHHNVRWVRVVVLSPDPPGPRITALLQHPNYRSRVTFIQGSPLHDDSLLKAHVDEAAAVMILAHNAPASSHAEDMSLTLQAISVMIHVEVDRRQGYGPRLLVELVDPNAALHLQAAGINQVVSSAQVKLSVLAQSCLCPGWAAIVANLLESRAALPPQVLQQGSWLAEYYVGAKKTFYSVEFSPAFTGLSFGDAAVHIFEYFELILVAVETKRHGQAGWDSEKSVIVNPGDDYVIGKGDRGFVLAESQADARVIWDYMATEDGRGGAIDENTGKLKERFSSPEEEEALAMETLGTAGVVGMGPEAFVDSMVFSRTLLHCQKRLADGHAPDSSVILGWAKQFQSSDGRSDDDLVRKVLASAGMEPPRPEAPHPSAFDPDGPVPVPTSHADTVRLFAATSGKHYEKPGALAKPARKPGGPGGPGARERFLSDADDAGVPSTVTSSLSAGVGGGSGSGSGGGSGFPVGAGPGSAAPAPMPGLVEADDVGGMLGGGSGKANDGAASARQEELRRQEEEDRESTDYDDDDDDDRHVRGGRSTGGTTRSSATGPGGGESFPLTDKAAVAASGRADAGKKKGSFTGDEILSALRTMEVSNLTGDEASRRLLALRSAANATQPATTAAKDAGAEVPAATAAAASTKTAAPADSKAPDSPPGAGGAPRVAPLACRRKIPSARHMSGHVVVLGFPARPSHLECFLRPLKGWTGGAGLGGGREVGGGGVPVVLVASDVSKLESALDVVDRNGFVNTSEVFLLEGSTVSQSDLENAGVRTAKAVLVMKDSKNKRFKDIKAGDPLRDAEALVSFIKMEDGLLNDNQHVVVELESAANVRFLHARAEAKSLQAIASLGGAGAGGAADEAHYLWPKYAAGMTYNSSFVDSMFGQAFYRPSRIALMERLLLLDRGEQQGQSGMAPFSASQAKTPTPSAAGAASRSRSGDSSPAESEELDRECCLRQMAVPPSFIGHSFGEMFQHLAAPPLRCVAFALLRARGTRSAPEPYVYTGPRADTVLHPGDRVFVLGKPPAL